MALPRIRARDHAFVTGPTNQPVRFDPRGLHFIRHDGVWGNHYVVSPGLYDREEAWGVLCTLALHGFNVIRIFLGENNVARPGDGELAPELVANLVDFLTLAESFGVHVILEAGTNFPTVGSKYVRDAAGNSIVDGKPSWPQWRFLLPEVVDAWGREVADLVRAVLVARPSLATTIFAIEIFNEAHVTTEVGPFRDTVGLFEFRGETYDLSNVSSRRELLERAAVWSVNTVCNRLAEVDPEIMVSCSVFPPQRIGRVDHLDNLPRYGADLDPRVPVPALALASSMLSFIDFHYLGYDNDQELADLGWNEIYKRKTVLCGEMRGPDPIAILEGLKARGVAGCVWWDHDTDDFAAMRDRGERFRKLSPAPATRFIANGTIYVTNQAIQVGFLTPEHQAIYQFFFGDPLDGPQPACPDLGAARLPPFYFQVGQTMYFAAGNGTYRGFTTDAAYQAHRATTWHRMVQHVGVLQQTPDAFLNEIAPL